MSMMRPGMHVPAREDVLGQAIPFDPARWLTRLPGADWWPEELDHCPTVSGRPGVDRRTVFEVARRSGTTEGRRHLLTATLVWGTGTRAQSVARRARIFERNTAAALDARLGEALEVLEKEGAVAAYYAFNNGHRIPFLGPAFFTKVLYFAGYERSEGPLRPLILDRFVVVGLRSAYTGETWRSGSWTTPRYKRYLQLAHARADASGLQPDQIEAALFAHGKRPK